MLRPTIRIILRSCLLLILAGVSFGAAQAQSGASTDAAPTAPLAGMVLIDALRAGGFNLYFRHAATEWSQNDLIRHAGDWTSCDPAQVRQLSAAGRETARRVGEAMRALEIPVAAVFASPYCRTVETAEAMSLGPVQTSTDVMNLRVADYFGGRETIIARAGERLSQAPPAGANQVFVAHGNVAIQTTGIYPQEGEALVFRPRGELGFEFVGRLPPRQWQALAAQ